MALWCWHREACGLGPTDWPGGRAAQAVVNWFERAVSRGAEPGGAHLDTRTTTAEMMIRNAGFIRQAREWDWGGRMNPAFRW
jgi:hypothetical protein